MTIQKLAAIEADLISAAGEGATALHSEIFKKFAALIEEPEDVGLIFDAVTDTIEQEKKTAATWGEGLGIAGAGIGLAGALAGPVSSIVSHFMNQQKKSKALSDAQAMAPQLFEQNPGRAQAIFDLIFNSAPDLASNTVLLVDLLTQMMSMPMLDLGTISKMVEISKMRAETSRNSGSMFAGNPAMTGFGQALGGVGDRMTAMRQPGFIDQLGRAPTMPEQIRGGLPPGDGAPKHAEYKPVLNWATEAAKKAGLTDSFTGSGDMMQQANQGTQMDDMSMGSSMMPLDSIVRELIQKQQELQQREEIVAQREQQIQEAMQQIQQAGNEYQGISGVNPNTGDPAEPPAAEPAAEEPAAEAPPMAEDPAAGGEQPGAEPMAAEPDASAPGDIPPGAPPGAEGDEEQTGVKPAPEGVEPDPAMGEETAEPMTGHGAPASEGGGAPEGMPPESGNPPSEIGEEPNGLGSQPEVPVGHPEPGDGAAAAMPTEAGEAEATGTEPTAAEEAPPAAEGETEDAPHGENPAAEGEEPPAAEGEEPPAAEGEEPPAAEGEEPGAHPEIDPEAALAAGPNTPESVEGTPEDAVADAASGAPEGSPEDEASDAQLAATLNAGGHAAGGGGEAAPPMSAPAPAPMPQPVTSAPAVPGVTPQAPPNPMSQEIVLPLRISIKLGEAEPKTDRATAYGFFNDAMADLFTQSR